MAAARAPVHRKTAVGLFENYRYGAEREGGGEGGTE